MPVIKFIKLNPCAVLPQYKTEGAAGADVVSIENVDIPAGQIRVIDLGFAVSIPKGYEIQVRPRSGLALKHGITILNSPGTIDSDYRGGMKVLLINHSEKDFSIVKGDRIAQLIVNKIEPSYFIEVTHLDTTNRGEKGFGSTGSN